MFLNGHRQHRSFPDWAEARYRRVLVNHRFSAESLLPWFPTMEGAHQGIIDFRDCVMITVEDPYAWKNFKIRIRPKVRPSGEVGCAKLKST